MNLTKLFGILFALIIEAIFQTRAKAAEAKANEASEAAALLAYQQTDKWLFDHRISGVPPAMICGSAPAGLDHDEDVICLLPGVSLLEPRAVRRSIRQGRSIYGGPTIRLTRGLSIRLGTGGSTGVSESESSDELRQIDQGTLMLTTKRLSFLGSLRTNSTSLHDLIGINDFGNGIQVHRKRKQKAETYVLTSALTVDGMLIRGSMIQLAIEMAKSAQEEAATVPGRIVWKRPPFYSSDNPLQCGSLYE